MPPQPIRQMKEAALMRAPRERFPLPQKLRGGRTKHSWATCEPPSFPGLQKINPLFGRLHKKPNSICLRGRFLPHPAVPHSTTSPGPAGPWGRIFSSLIYLCLQGRFTFAHPFLQSSSLKTKEEWGFWKEVRLADEAVPLQKGCSSAPAAVPTLQGRTQFLCPQMLSFWLSIIKWRAAGGGEVRDAPMKFAMPEHYSCNTQVLTAADPWALSELAASPPQLMGCCSAVSVSASYHVVSVTLLAPDFKRNLIWEEKEKYIKSEISWLLKTLWVDVLVFCIALTG